MVQSLLSAVATGSAFNDSAAAYLLLTPGQRIVAANRAYLMATDRPAEGLLGRPMFDAFPDNPADPAATGVHNLGASLEYVVRNGAVHDMLVQRYDVQAEHAAGRFVPRVWSPVNTPVVDPVDGVVGVIHHVEDITGLQAALAGRQALPGGNDASRRGEAIRSALLAAHRRTGGPAMSSRENQHLRAALTSVVASRGMFGARNRLISRRRQLWLQAGSDIAAANWAGWVRELCRLAVSSLRGIDAAAVSVRADPGQEIVAATSGWAHRLEQLHFTVGEGPAITAYTTMCPMLVRDLSSQQSRWPGFVAAAASQVCGLFVFPLQLDGSPIGTMSLYARTPAAWVTCDWSDAAILADLMTSALLIDLDSSPVDGDLAEVGTLRQVGIAAGVLAARQGISLDEATSRLRAHAFTQDRPILDVAGDVIDGHSRLED